MALAGPIVTYPPYFAFLDCDTFGLLMLRGEIRLIEGGSLRFATTVGFANLRRPSIYPITCSRAKMFAAAQEAAKQISPSSLKSDALLRLPLICKYTSFYKSKISDEC